MGICHLSVWNPPAPSTDLTVSFSGGCSLLHLLVCVWGTAGSLALQQLSWACFSFQWPPGIQSGALSQVRLKLASWAAPKSLEHRTVVLLFSFPPEGEVLWGAFPPNHVFCSLGRRADMVEMKQHFLTISLHLFLAWRFSGLLWLPNWFLELTKGFWPIHS